MADRPADGAKPQRERRRPKRFAIEEAADEEEYEVGGGVGSILGGGADSRGSSGGASSGVASSAGASIAGASGVAAASRRAIFLSPTAPRHAPS